MQATRVSPAEQTMAFLQDVLGDLHPRDFRVRLWDGSTWEPDDGHDARFTVVLKHPSSLKRMFWPLNEVSLGEAFIFDDFDVEGDLEAVAGLGDHLESLAKDRARLARYAARLMRMPGDGRREGARAAELDGRRHSKRRDADAIRYHYDVSNDFYRLWLDRHMVYSCAYFADGEQDLDAAQERKLDLICRKLRLRPGERLLDIGCGWGGLLVHAAREYGVDATGITLSEPQARLAQRRIAEAGLSERCRARVLDYRDVDESRPFDKLVSVGMFEHVGAELLPTYFEKASRLLAEGGTFLNHGISCSVFEHRRKHGPSFSQKYVFPDGELLPISTTLAAAEDAGFEVRDVEDLREHYAMTLRHWVRRLEERADEARACTDEATYRVWRLYMTFAGVAFARNRIQVYQTLLHKHTGEPSGLPLTREDWYA
ncbi:MAG: class I SAM-dependent methyltransferase [Coriobacteriia bacterium]|nr:class I SAM-dependent methyltransferase [Coriobacteriia bacterium]